MISKPFLNTDLAELQTRTLQRAPPSTSSDEGADVKNNNDEASAEASNEESNAPEESSCQAETQEEPSAEAAEEPTAAKEVDECSAETVTVADDEKEPTEGNTENAEDSSKVILIFF